MKDAGKSTSRQSKWQDCTCHFDCTYSTERCSLAGEWHVHPGEPCPVHPDAPGDR